MDSIIIFPDRVVGKGKFGIVVDGLNQQTTEIIVAKELNENKIKIQNIENEIKINTLLSSEENMVVAKYYGALQKDHLHYLVFEKCSELKFDNSSFVHILNLMRQCSRILVFLKKHGIRHNDIKPDNLMMRDGIVKLIDFGLSQFITDTPKYQGSFNYMSPEKWNSSKLYTAEDDMWSMGITLYFLIYNVLPFQATTSVVLKRKVLNDNINYPSKFSKVEDNKIQSILQRMLVKDYTKRIKPEELQSLLE